MPIAGLLFAMVATFFSTNMIVRQFIPTFAAPEPIEWQADWIKAPEPSYQAFFRRTLDLPFLPEQAWIAISSNDYILYVNGVEVARNRYVNNMGQGFQTRSSLRSQASYSTVADLSRAPELRRSPNQEKLTPYYVSLIGALRPGRNVIAIAIEDSQDAPSFSATGEIRDKTHTVSLDTRAEDWHVSIKPQRIGIQEWFESPSQEEGWVSAVRAEEDHELFTTTEPNVWRAPQPEALMSGPTIGRYAAFRTTLTGMSWHGVERGAWIRIYSNWPYTITIDGRAFASAAPSRGLAGREITAFLDKPTSSILVRLERPEYVVGLDEWPQLAADFIVDGRQVAGSENWSVLTDAGYGDRVENWGPVADGGKVADPMRVALLTKFKPVDWSTTYWSIWAGVLAGSLAVWATMSLLVSPVANRHSIAPGRLAGGLIAVPALAAILMSLARLRYKESDTILWFHDPANSVILVAGLIAVFGAATLLMTIRVAPVPVLSSVNSAPRDRARIFSAILLFAILGLATYLRMYNISVEDLQADENVSFDAARGIIRTGLPEAVSGVLYTRSPLYHYMLAGWILLFGDSVEVARSMSVVAGVAVIAVAYHFALQLRTGRLLALALALWLAVDPWQIIVSLNIRFYQQMQFFGLLSFLFFLKGFVFSRDRRLQFWFFFFCTSATLSQEVFVTMFPGLCIAGYFYYRPFRLSEDWRIVAGTFAVLAITIVDLAIFQIMCLTQPVNIGTTSGSILQLHTLNVTAFVSSFLSGSLRSHFFVTVLLVVALVMRTRTSNPGVGVGLVLVIVGIVVTTILVVQTANRYLFILKPVLLITAWAAVREIVIDWSERLYPGPDGLVLRQRWKGMVFALLGAAAIADSEVWRTLGSQKQKTILQHYEAYQYIAENMRRDDKVVSVSPMSAAIVLGKLDYYLMESIYFDEIYISRDDGIIDRWSGGQLISNVERLRQVFLENERVWVMLNIQEGGRFSDETLRYLSGATEVQKTFFGGEVYLWTRSKGLSAPVARQGRDIVSF